MQLTGRIPYHQKSHDTQLAGGEAQTRSTENAAIAADEHPEVEIGVEPGNVRPELLVAAAVDDTTDILAPTPPVGAVLRRLSHALQGLDPAPEDERLQCDREADEEVGLEQHLVDGGTAREATSEAGCAPEAA